MLKHGRIDIVQLLRDLPQTKHHPGTFSVDVLKATVSSQCVHNCTFCFGHFGVLDCWVAVYVYPCVISCSVALPEDRNMC